MPFELTRREFMAASLAAASSPLVLRGADESSGNTDAKREVPWLGEIQMPPKKLPDDAPKLQPLLVTDDGEPITSLDAWRTKRESLQKWWLDYLHPLDARKAEPPALKIVAEDRDAGVVRQLVQYEVEPDIVTQAYLLKPIDAGQKKLPAVAVFHSTVDHSIRQPAGVEGNPEKAFGLKLAQQGCVTICPRNYLWPTNHKIEAQAEAARFHERHPKSKGMAKMLHDALVAVDILCAQPEVDSRRIGSIGHSLGAKEVLYLAAFDERVKVTISSEGGIGTTFSNWDAPWYLGPTIHEDKKHHEHHEVLALVAPRPFLLIGGDSADGSRGWPFIEQALGVYRLHDQPPRLGQFNHGQGHTVPPAAERRIYEWFKAYL